MKNLTPSCLMMVDRHWKVPVYFGVPDNMHWVWIRTLTVSSGNPTKMPADPETKKIVDDKGAIHK